MSAVIWSALLYAALVSLSLSFDRHRRDVFKDRQTRPGKRLSRRLGFMGIAGSLIICLMSTPGGQSWVLWFCTFAVAGGVNTIALSYVPRVVAISGRIALAIVTTAGAFKFFF